ncbi:NADH-quinone oxidoreductase subunit NuoB [Geomesophilobacter sediminis]|uniref:NADH-quinone oxidoreductase subunit NuoB n=1 Tax=Geomesophilobacter sediminis TaxID=2798584 RepID=A0A8J7S8U9_9BACT|nr:NADH-quinone oxidoreductase subunit NuoB [Geomesophilobacter sediminis]MBJ6727871.1 NADH-quinone oxidoreductase subunit NuoB [Geomesophilobacter sediminis]
MIKAILARMQQGHRTTKFPDQPMTLPERFRGYPVLKGSNCPPSCQLCKEVCPVGAIGTEPLTVDMGKCLFCTECLEACPHGGVSYGNDARLATRKREDLVVVEGGERQMAYALERKMLSLFGRSLKFRSVVAGGCNACEADTNVLSTIGWDLGRFGIQFVASPRHADGLWVTGPVTENMREALMLTYEAIPAPKLVVACGACSISGGPFFDSSEVHNGVEKFLPVDLYIPGCPPHPLTILDGLLRLVDRIKE